MEQIYDFGKAFREAHDVIGDMIYYQDHRHPLHWYPMNEWAGKCSGKHDHQWVPVSSSVINSTWHCVNCNITYTIDATGKHKWSIRNNTQTKGANKMNFIEALEKAKEGHYIKRKGWSSTAAWQKDDLLYIGVIKNGKAVDGDTQFSPILSDMQATDWEVYNTACASSSVVSSDYLANGVDVEIELKHNGILVHLDRNPFYVRNGDKIVLDYRSFEC